jgi:hypothetical protein
LAVDVVGFSRLMGEDEAGTARAVREHRDAARPLVTTSGGRIVKTMGDGLLLEFPSVIAAVDCAIAIQKLMVERNAGTPEEKRIVYRIGGNIDDVLIEGRGPAGDGIAGRAGRDAADRLVARRAERAGASGRLRCADGFNHGGDACEPSRSRNTTPASPFSTARGAS